MWAMSAKKTVGKSLKRVVTRPSPEARQALRELLTALKAPARLGEDLDQEDLIAASWLWMAERPDVVAKGIKEHLEACKAWKARIKQVQEAETDASTIVERLTDPVRAAADETMNAARPRPAKPKGPKTGRG